MAETASYIVWVNTEKKIASFVEEKGFDKMEFQDHNYFMDCLKTACIHVRPVKARNIPAWRNVFGSVKL